METELRHAARVLWRAPGFTAIAILSLALGIGANTAIFSIINAVMLKPLPVREPSRLVEIVAGDQDEFPAPLWDQLREQQRVLDPMMAWSAETFDLAIGGVRRPVKGQYVSGDF